MMRGWIPPLPLACGAASFGLSWIGLFAVARAGGLDLSLLSLGWVHLVALAWITTIALAVLLHAVPGFLDVEWSGTGAGLARASSLVFAVASLALAGAFFVGSLAGLQVAGTLVLGALVVYTAAIAQPIAAAIRAGGVGRSIARAFGATLALLVLTATFGAAFAYALGGRLPSSLLNGAPQAHALLGIGGWLTLLVVGVSARTMGPIAGTRSRFPAFHIGASTALLAGTIAAATGAATHMAALLFAGCTLLLLGTVAYLADIADVLGRATVPHRPPQYFMLCAGAWAVTSAALLFATAAGVPFASATVYAALIGWVGGAVLAHLHHIGIRVLLTALRGEDDETRPGTVLTSGLTWTTFACYQAAAIAGTVALALGSPAMLQLAALLGFTSFLGLVANVRGAMAR